MKTICTLLMLAAVFSFTSCNDDEQDAVITPAGVDTEEALEGTWILREATVDPEFDTNGDGVAETDVFATYTPCRQDNLFIFTEGNDYFETEGATACDGRQPDEEIEDGDYIISADDNDLVISTGITDADTYDIVSIDESNMVLTNEIEEDGETYTVTYTYEKVN